MHGVHIATSLWELQHKMKWKCITHPGPCLAMLLINYLILLFSPQTSWYCSHLLFKKAFFSAILFQCTNVSINLWNLLHVAHAGSTIHHSVCNMLRYNMRKYLRVIRSFYTCLVPLYYIISYMHTNREIWESSVSHKMFFKSPGGWCCWYFMQRANKVFNGIYILKTDKTKSVSQQRKRIKMWKPPQKIRKKIETVYLHCGHIILTFSVMQGFRSKHLNMYNIPQYHTLKLWINTQKKWRKKSYLLWWLGKIFVVGFHIQWSQKWPLLLSQKSWFITFRWFFFFYIQKACGDTTVLEWNFIKIFRMFEIFCKYSYASKKLH